MSDISKLMMRAAAGSGGAATAIEDVFAIYNYIGNNNGTSGGANPTRKIENGINLSEEGGAVIFKPRDTNPYNNDFNVFDSARNSFTKSVRFNTDEANQDLSNLVINSVQTDGFTLGYYGWTNYDDNNMSSFTFRKASRFFDIVTWTGDGTTDFSKTISHNLGVKPGMIWVKRTDSTGNWAVYHRNFEGLAATGNPGYGASSYNPGGEPRIPLLVLNDTNNVGYQGSDNFAYVNQSSFAVSAYNSFNNVNGASYVAYVFAHDPDGPSGDGSDGLIACGEYIADGNHIDVDVGFQPQWVWVRRINDTGNGLMFDNIRGFNIASSDSNAKYFQTNSNTGDSTSSYIGAQHNGFRVRSSNSDIGASGGHYVWCAIRKANMKVPETGSEVFQSSAAAHTSNSVITLPNILNAEMGMYASTAAYAVNGLQFQTRTTHPRSTGFEGDSVISTVAYGAVLDQSKSVYVSQYDFWNDRNNYLMLWNAKKGVFNTTAYTGTGSNLTIKHGLGATPEMFIVKDFLSSAPDYKVYHSGLGANNYLGFASTGNNAPTTSTTTWNNTAPTETEITIGADSDINTANSNYVVMSFATLPGVSKVGTYTGDGTTNGTKTIDCGFTTGARWVLAKRSDGIGNWAMVSANTGLTNETSGHGSILYTTTGSHQWTAPSGVTSVSVVAVGSGGEGGVPQTPGGGGGGGGGGLGYKNNYPVSPGTQYALNVGGNPGSTLYSQGATGTGQAGEDSYFVNTSTVKGGGGLGGPTGPGGAGGTYTGDGGGNGGAGGAGSPAGPQSGYAGGGGGGAGGYSGTGGTGGQGTSSTNVGGNAGTSGAGGGGGGGGGTGGQYFTDGRYGGQGSGGGGGVAAFGQGSNGAGGAGSVAGIYQSGFKTPTGDPAPGAQYGGAGSDGYSLYYGGGGTGGGRTSGGGGSAAGFGGTGFVRIVWPGNTRQFPSTNVDVSGADATFTSPRYSTSGGPPDNANPQLRTSTLETNSVGFTVNDTGNSFSLNTSGATYVYVAIA